MENTVVSATIKKKMPQLKFYPSYSSNENLKCLYFSFLVKHKRIFSIVNHRNYKDVHSLTYLFLLNAIAKPGREACIVFLGKRAVFRGSAILLVIWSHLLYSGALLLYPGRVMTRRRPG